MNKNDSPRRALGKGLHSLLPARVTRSEEEAPPAATSVTHLALDDIQPNPNQPRSHFEDLKLAELARSIKADGVIQPLIVRRLGRAFQLVAGERRLRAAKLAGLTQVPVVVQDISDDKLLEIALIENIQREDLNPIELADAFQRMSAELHLNHEDIGERTGKDRVTITNYIRLLQLPNDLQQLVASRALTPGHARAILKIVGEDQQRELAKRAIRSGWSVRQIEHATSLDGVRRRGKDVDAQTPDPNVKAAIAELERTLGTRVRIIEKRGGKGHIEIEYYTGEDLNRIYDLIAKPEE